MSDEQKNTAPKNKDPKNKEKLLAPFAGALLIAAAFFGLAALVGFGSEGNKSEWGWGFAVLGVIALAGWFFSRRKTASAPGDEFSRQRTMLGVNSVVSTLLLLILLVGINYIASRRHKVFDLTSNRINSLSDQTTKALGQLKKPVTLRYIWAPSEVMRQVDPNAQAILTAYKSASDNIKVEYLNAVQDPLKLQSLNLSTFTGQPLLLISDTDATPSTNDAKTRPVRQEVSVVDEQNITSALLKIADPKPRVLYFLSGHGEMSPLQTGQGARLNGARRALEAQNYTLKNLSLIGGKSQIPTDAAAVVAMSPQADLGEGEAAKLKKYLAVKGRLLLFLDPPRTPIMRWKQLVAGLNIQLLDGIILEFDKDKMYSTPQYIIGELGDTARHPLLRGVNASVVFPGSSPLRIAAASAATAAITATPLFETTPISRSVMQGTILREGTTGPFVIAAAVERTAGQPMRAVVAGNAVFATDAAFNQFGNAGFFLSSINWVVGNDTLVSIPPKPPVTNTLEANDVTRRFAILFSLVALPLGVLLLGTMVWWKRR